MSRAATPIASLLAGYFLLALLCAGELLLPGRSLFRWDTLLYNWPVILEARSQILSGHWPFWASSFCCGTPLLENINAGVLYPLRLLCWLLPLRAGYHFFLFAHVWLSFAAMHLFLRRGLGRTHREAFFGALVFGASGYARGMWDTHNFVALPWIPLTLAFLLEARRGTVLWPLAGTAAGLAMLVLGGDVQATILCVPVALLLVLLQPRRGRLVAVLGGALLLAGLLTAPQWIPALLATGQSYRAAGLDAAEAMERSYHPLRLLELWLPHVFGTRGEWLGATLAGAGATKTVPWTASAHVGRLALPAVFFAFGKRRTRNTQWALAVVLVSLFLSFGRFLPGFRHWLSIPMVGSFRYPEKYLLWTTFALAVLAAQGSGRIAAVFRSAAAGSRRRVLARYSLVLVAGALCASLALLRVAPQSGPACAWLVNRWIVTAAFIALLFLAGLPRQRARRFALLCVLAVADLLLPWYLETPTSSRLASQQPPAVAQLVRASGRPTGRFLYDPAVRQTILPPGFADLAPTEKKAVILRERLAYNSPRLWGLRTADGFSPLEADRMRGYRLACLGSEGAPVPSAERMADFCRGTGVEWILTAPSRREALRAAGLATEEVQAWGAATDRAVLLRVTNATEAECTTALAGQTAARVVNVWRSAPGRIRVDLQPGGPADLTVKETFAPGWRATDAHANGLEPAPTPEGSIRVKLPAGTNQVRLRYKPRSWVTASAIGTVGALLLGLMIAAAIGTATLRSWLVAPAAAALASALIFVCLGLAARSHWSCTFDEGYHITRGIARIRTGDSRVSYSHPPLQNIVCAYFAGLAHGTRIEIPSGNGWKRADVRLLAAEFAAANRQVFPQLVRAARWGTTLFGAGLCMLAALWAWRAAGPWAGWLAGLGLAANPNIIAHGNLATTDIGVVTCLLGGSFCLWQSVTHRRARTLAWSSALFVLAAVMKYYGLIWLAAYLCLCIPILAVSRRAPRLLWHLPAAAVLFAALLACLYGIGPQLIRIGNGAWPDGRTWIAGRYVEGLLRQGEHALSGHRAFFAGHRFMKSDWWHLPAAIALKTPAAWLIAGLAGLVCLPFARRGPARAPAEPAWVVWIPLGVFSILLFAVNRMAIGIRHALVIEVLLVLAAAIGCGRIRQAAARRLLGGALLLATLFTAASTFPNYIGYFPSWAGGSRQGYRWLVDSNYDWGQDLEELERNWAALTDANGGHPPHLLYFGFVDPLSMYGMPTARPSLHGAMGQQAMSRGDPESYERWIESIRSLEGTVVTSVSARQIDPYGIDMQRLRESRQIGRIGTCFFVHHVE